MLGPGSYSGPKLPPIPDECCHPFRFKAATDSGLSWHLPDTLTDAELERLLFPALRKSSASDRVFPHLLWVHQELQKKSVTLFLLWQEYRVLAPIEN
jgi:transposase